MGQASNLALQDDGGQVEDTLTGKFLTFLVDQEYYGIPIQYVKEIVGLHTITEVPEMPVYIKGIINLRGRIIPIMDIRLRFKKPYRAYNDRTCIIVVDIDELCVGLIVDSVSEVLWIASEDIVPPPGLGIGGARYVMGVGRSDGGAKLLLDCNRLLNDHELEQLDNLNTPREEL
ncbi:purine-binding chemotaxis protein CheW [Paenibacillus sp. F411]|uniref:CheW protein n=1 Tax=Paenibacillus algicola TaxID=2565926 RepID=A0A4P8XK79_9BACL|nr:MULTISPECIES: chemotaxis protein CheW [Paenibacillus]MBO2944083.1 purine-binding chemotaxis protein CheW [Paenibacillus sp. F411]QCT01811.1 CheW protein [Paenibacillus algicola]